MSGSARERRGLLMNRRRCSAQRPARGRSAPVIGVSSAPFLSGLSLADSFAPDVGFCLGGLLVAIDAGGRTHRRCLSCPLADVD